MTDELQGRELYYTLLEVRVLTERYRRTYNRSRQHRALGYRPPAPEALLPVYPVPTPVGLTFRVVQTTRKHVTGQSVCFCTLRASPTNIHCITPCTTYS